MPSLGTGEIIVIMVLVLVLFGPNRLPELARGIGKGMREMRKISAEFQNQLSLLADEDEQPKKANRAEVRTASGDSTTATVSSPGAGARLDQVHVVTTDPAGLASARDLQTETSSSQTPDESAAPGSATQIPARQAEDATPVEGGVTQSDQKV